MSDLYITADTVPIDANRPLLIVDADEVLLRFVAGLEAFLDPKGLVLDLTSYRLHGNVRVRATGEPLLDVEVTALLEEFRSDLDDLEAVEHADAALAELSPLLQIVVLSNVSPHQAPARLRNLQRLGWHLPLLCNAGPKGPAVAVLARRAAPTAFFVDDIGQHLHSAAANAPAVIRIHLVGDDRLKPLLPPAPDAHLRAEDWREVSTFIRARLIG
jgi:hypothetical protein